ncbi:MAG: hypothetical protein H6924_12285 [Alphaproteobacteria bacterium]|nr:hypothetical protein [Alphaproteobacteria bacterium]
MPLIGTTYRALTGDKLDGFARWRAIRCMAELWGAVGAAAIIAFEAVTGKSAGTDGAAWLDPARHRRLRSTPPPINLCRVAANLDAPRVTPAHRPADAAAGPTCSSSRRAAGQ